MLFNWLKGNWPRDLRSQIVSCWLSLTSLSPLVSTGLWILSRYGPRRNQFSLTLIRLAEDNKLGPLTYKITLNVSRIPSSYHNNIILLLLGSYSLVGRLILSLVFSSSWLANTLKLCSYHVYCKIPFFSKFCKPRKFKNSVIRYQQLLQPTKKYTNIFNESAINFNSIAQLCLDGISCQTVQVL